MATADTGFGASSTSDGQVPALQEISGEPLVSRVVRACGEASRVERSVVIGEQDAPGAPFGADDMVEAAASPADNIQRGLAALNGCEVAVVLPGDVPFVSGAEIDAFIAAARARDAQMAYPLVSRPTYEATFPEFSRTYFRLSEGELTGGDALFLHVPTFVSNAAILEEAMELRNEPWKLALAVNPMVLLSYRSGGLSLPDIEEAVRKVLGVQGAAVIVEAPGLATEVRKPIDLRSARERLEGS